MKNHQDSKSSVIAERFCFNKRDRKQSEQIVQYVAELRRLTESCDYGTCLEHMLHDRLICCIQHECIQQLLLSEGDSLMLKKALDIALAMETAFEKATVISNSRATDAECKFESINTIRDRKVCNKLSMFR